MSIAENNKYKIVWSDVNPQKISISFKVLLWIVGIMLLHLLCVYQPSMAMVVSVIEAVIVIGLLLNKRYSQSLFLFGVFVLTSYDAVGFFAVGIGLDKLYNVQSLPFINAYFSVAYLFFLFILTFMKVSRNKVRYNNPLIPFAKYTMIAGCAMGVIFNLLHPINKNALITDIGMCIQPAMMIYVFIYFFYEDPKLLYKYESFIIHLLVSYIIVAWITISLNIFCDFDPSRSRVLMLPLASFYVSSVILFYPLMKSRTDKYVILAAFISAVVFQFAFDSCLNGKSWMVFGTTIMVTLYLWIRKNARNNVLLGIITVIIVIVLVAISLPQISIFAKNSEYEKLREVTSVFDAGKSGNINDMGSSSSARTFEFVDITEEHIKEPIFALTGRGYGGYIPSNGYFIWKGYEDGSFGEEQYKTNQFYTVHGSMNISFLKFGLIGLIWLLYISFMSLVKVKYSPWFYIGFIWLFYFWGFSNNLMFFGLPMLIASFQRLRSHQKS